MNISVIGLGKLGLPLMALLAENNYQVYGVDKSEALIKSLKSQTFYSNETGLMDLLSTNQPRLHYSTSVSEITEKIDLVFVIVPTPSEENGRFSNYYVLDAVKEIGFFLKDKDSGTVINIVSTVMPGSCDGIISQTLEQTSGRKIGLDVGLCYSPEFIALGSVVKDMQFPDMHLVGFSHQWAGDLLEVVLKRIAKNQVPCLKMSLIEAELVKISVNNFVTMKIAFANSLMQIADHLGNIDIDKVTSAIGLDSRIGRSYMKAAAPYGGPCFPRDTRALTSIFLDAGMPVSLSSTTEKMNLSYVKYVSEKVLSAVNISQSIGVLGISYKPGTPVIDESPGLLITNVLIQSGNKVLVWDDEGATDPTSMAESCELDDILERADYFIITRNLKNFGAILSRIKENKKNYLDLWRQDRNVEGGI